MTKQPQSTSNYAGLREAIEQTHRVCQDHAAAAANQALSLRNWLIGAHIVEYEQHGSDRAEYGERLLERLAEDLSRESGRGFGLRMLRDMRRFYLEYPQVYTTIRQTVIAELSAGKAEALRELAPRIRQSAIAESTSSSPAFHAHLFRRVTGLISFSPYATIL
ncbi:MAG: hypothetical protein HY318_14850 [Armatimonadetes bacterium]|nr:hypothetical protein [Armatimonadota bacterium]